MTLYDKAGVLIDPRDEGKSIGQRSVTRRGAVAYLKREHADVPSCA
jgi:hypothetical protein